MSFPVVIKSTTNKHECLMPHYNPNTENKVKGDLHSCVVGYCYRWRSSRRCWMFCGTRWPLSSQWCSHFWKVVVWSDGLAADCKVIGDFPRKWNTEMNAAKTLSVCSVDNYLILQIWSSHSMIPCGCRGAPEHPQNITTLFQGYTHSVLQERLWQSVAFFRPCGCWHVFLLPYRSCTVSCWGESAYWAQLYSCAGGTGNNGRVGGLLFVILSACMSCLWSCHSVEESVHINSVTFVNVVFYPDWNNVFLPR